MTRQLAYRLLFLQVFVLFVGTQMPNAWRNGALVALHAPGIISSLAHFVLFASMAAIALAKPLPWSGVRVVLAAFGLALLTEGLQFFAIDRHPRWLDVGIDMAGVLTAITVLLLVSHLHKAWGQAN